MTREMIIGLGLAFLFHLVVMGIRVGSRWSGTRWPSRCQLGRSRERRVDAALSRMNETLFFLAFLGVNGYHWVVRPGGVHDRAPVGAFFGDGAMT